jgi:hypothetical protein
LGELSIQGHHVLLTLGDVFLGKDGVGRAFRNANCAVDALIGIDGQKVRTFTKTVHGTNIHTVGVLTADTRFGDNVSHGLNFY